MCPIEARLMSGKDTLVVKGIHNRVEKTQQPIVIKGTAEVDVLKGGDISLSDPQPSAIVVGTPNGGYVLGQGEHEWKRIRNAEEVVFGDVVYQGVLEQGKRPSISFNLP